MLDTLGLIINVLVIVMESQPFIPVSVASNNTSPESLEATSYSGVSVFESLNVPFPSTNLQEIASKSEAVKSFNI